MRIEGKLTKWNDDRGFGFITPTQGGPEVFVHISSFPRDGLRPSVGEHMSFEVEIDKDGKKRANNLIFTNRKAPRPYRPPASKQYREKKSILGQIASLVFVVALAVYGYSEFSRRVTPKAAKIPESAQPAEFDSSFPYQCDGRTHCSQMSSCAEATFFLNNCPNVKMDGNNDGVPCEQQWCTD